MTPSCCIRLSRSWSAQVSPRARRALREGLRVENAADLIWTLTSLAVHDLLVVERGWTSEQYERWLTDALMDALLGR